VSHARGLQLEALGRDRAAARGGHLVGHLPGHLALGVQAFGDAAFERRAGIHLPQQRHLARVGRRRAGAAQAGVGHQAAALQHERQAVGEGHHALVGVQPRAELLREAVQEALGGVGPRRPRGQRLAGQRQAQLDAVLGLEVAAREVADAGERHERHLAGLDARVQRGPQRGGQRPVGVQRERRVGPRARPRDRDAGPCLGVERGLRDEHVAGVVGAAQEDDQQAGVQRRARGRGPGPRGAQRQAAGERGVQEVAALHGGPSIVHEFG